MGKVRCNFECYSNGTCPFPDCITDGVTPQERAEQKRRDKSLFSYGTVTPARRNRKNRGRVT